MANLRITPRDYQDYAVQSIFDYFESKGADAGNPLVVMPTGTGKSVVIAVFLHRVYELFATQRVMMLTHVKELIDQNYEKLLAVWPEAPVGVYSASLGRRDKHNPIVYGGIASVAKCIADFGPRDLVLIDEAHLVNPEESGMYRSVIKYLQTLRPKLKVIGFTATPWKLGHGSLVEDGLFTDICCNMASVEAFNWLVDQGYLATLVPKRTELQLDVTGVKKRGPDYINSELQNAVNKTEITLKACREAIELGFDRQSWLVFASGVDHTIAVAETLTSLGIPAVAIYGDMGNAARDAALADFKSGKYRAAVNNNVLTTGFDHPLIDLILVLRPTLSPVLWVQMLGRGTRPVYAPGFDLSTKEGRCQAIENGGKLTCLVLDFAGNTRSLGPINDPKVPKRKGEGGGEAPVKECPCCKTWNHASARYCGGVPKDDPEFDKRLGYCGAEFVIQTKLKEEASTVDIVKRDMPVTAVWRVQHISCTPYTSRGGDEMMRVVYYCDKRKKIEQFVAPDHATEFMKKQARDWWRERVGTLQGMPNTTKELLECADLLPQATHLRVWANKKPYPQLLATCFDGRGWSDGEPVEAPTVEIVKMVELTKPKAAPKPANKPTVAELEQAFGSGSGFNPEIDDDIPF